MLFIPPLIALAATSLVHAAPISHRSASDNTVLVFQFAEVLEQLEAGFYSSALSKFQDSDFTAAGFSSPQVPIQQFQTIKNDEQTHATFLQSGLKSLGSSPISGCKFNFDSVLTDVETMITTARTVENVGISAFLGAATLLSDPVILDEAASILTVEARHQTVENILDGDTAIPSAFDVPLAPNEVLAIAGSFISGCSLGISSNPPLTITNTGAISCGTTLTFKADAINGSTPDDKLFCQILVPGATSATVMPLNQCVVPTGTSGVNYVFVTNDNQPLLNNVHDRDSSEVVAGPAPFLVKTDKEALGSLVKNGGNSSQSGSAGESVTTQTISPGDASSIISGASATGSPNASPTGTDNGAITVNGMSMVPVQQPAAPASSSGASPTVSGASSSASPSPVVGANVKTGANDNGAITVHGMSEVPIQQPGSSAASSAPPSTSAGPSGTDNGAITVNGMSMVPVQQPAPAAASASSAASSGGGGGGYGYGGY